MVVNFFSTAVCIKRDLKEMNSYTKLWKIHIAPGLHFFLFYKRIEGAKKTNTKKCFVFRSIKW